MIVRRHGVDDRNLARVGRRGVIGGGLGIGLALSTARSNAATADLCVVGKDGWLFLSLDDTRRCDMALVRQMVELTNTAVAVIKAAHINVAISYAPAKSRVYPEHLPESLAWASPAERRYAAVLEEFRKANTLAPDQAALFRTLRQAGVDDLFFKADTHWTGFGAQQSAMLMGVAMTWKMGLPPCAKPAAKLAAPTMVVQARNDLASLLPSTEQWKYPSQRYWMRRVAELDGQGLLEEDESDVAVIGDSLMQPAYGFANVLAETLDRPVSLLWKEHSWSPWHSLLSFVRSDGFIRRPPRAIVWGFNECDMELACDDSAAWGRTAMSPARFIDGLRSALANFAP